MRRYGIIGFVAAVAVAGFVLMSDGPDRAEPLPTTATVESHTPELSENGEQNTAQVNSDKTDGPDASKQNSQEPADTSDAAEYSNERAEIERLAGRLLVVGFRGTTAPPGSYIDELLTGVGPAGVILFDRDVPSGNFPRNIENPSQTKALVSSLKALSPQPLLIAVDSEGGAVNRLKPQYGFIDVPSHASLGETGDTDHTYAVASGLARQLAGLGFTLNFAPVVDLNTNPASPIIGRLGRSFSADPNVVSAHAAAFARAHRDSGVIPVLKHFPGHGSATGDTHAGIVDVTSTWRSSELDPYRTLINQGWKDPIMTAHIINRAWGTAPATLSRPVLTDMLRRDLGFDGVIVTDDMQMGAITAQFGLEEAAVRALEAGADMIVVSNNIDRYDPQAPYRVRDAVVHAVESGRISRERLEQSAGRIETLIQKLPPSNV